ncbi:MAG: sodium:solute symporter [Candidatus Kapaibacterium sp.]
MSIVDYSIFMFYMLLVFLVGIYFFRKNKDREDYYVGGRSIKPFHVGLSVVATDVGGGFSIGLGGLGFLIGLSGSWLLFTGLVGAWLSAVFVIPRLKKLDAREGMLTYPDFLRYRYGGAVALVAALISGIGYMGFTGGQILAGAKLASATLFSDAPFGLDPMTFSLVIIAGVILIYTVLGGLKAVIYTDTVQWIILLGGLIFLAIPFSMIEIGGLDGLNEKLPAEFLSLTNVSAVQVINWFVTIVPIWLIAMTLYQRMYACKDEKDAKKAWYIAGVFEYPVMAFVGVFLGMVARIYFPEAEPEMGLPMLLKDVLPIGVKGVIIAAYFSAIMSTADSCLIASSGNFVNDIIERYFFKNLTQKQLMLVSQVVTLGIGLVTIWIASSFHMVLDIILDAYSFMVGGLFVPTLAAYFAKRVNPKAALVSMIAGGVSTMFFLYSGIELPLGLDESFYGIMISALSYFVMMPLAGKKVRNAES